MASWHAGKRPAQPATLIHSSIRSLPAHKSLPYPAAHTIWYAGMRVHILRASQAHTWTRSRPTQKEAASYQTHGHGALRWRRMANAATHARGPSGLRMPRRSYLYSVMRVWMSMRQKGHCCSEVPHSVHVCGMTSPSGTVLHSQTT